MLDLTLNIIFYLFGLALAIIPFFLTYKKNKTEIKPLWYKISLPIIIIGLIVLGTIKTYKDFSSQNTIEKKFDSLKLTLGTLNDTVIKKQDKYNLLIKHLDSIGVEVHNNVPVKVFKTNIRSVGTLNQY